MSSFFARCVGLADGSKIPPDAAVLVVERRSTLSRSEAQVAVFDYFGTKRAQLSAQMEVSPETIGTYWRRIYYKTNLCSRTAVREWVEQILQQELQSDSTS